MHLRDGELRGTDALHALQMILRGGWRQPAPAFADGPVARLASAAMELQAGSGAAPSPLDLAVLVRHLLRWCTEAMDMAGAIPELLVPRAIGWPERQHWDLVGVSAEEQANAYKVAASQWIPTWLPDVPSTGVDGRAVGAPVRRLTYAVPADPFLTLAFPDRLTYRSSGQRMAVRASLMTPPGSTLLVGLPTGDGKSLIFQVLAKTGFPLQAEQGLIVVVTPTVALALDHQETARYLHLADGPLAYQGRDSTGANQQILQRVEAGTQRIVFTSPEAICRGPLRGALTRAAERGYLSALVIDEAHLIETWGKEFRPDFQILAGIRTNLLRANQATPFRTILLSATITDQTVATVRTLFGTGADGREAFQLIAASYLRPEIEYWAMEPVSVELREEYVREALYHLPRPAILYVTTIDDANSWLQACRRLGFQRIGMMTGETSPDERERLIRAWKTGELDLVVGNAAFGLGIDKQDVRAVIHACVPESLDRFYQEVGRGGRDGRASLSLLLPTHADVQMARSMQAKHIGMQKGHQRWEAMYLQGRIYEPETDSHWVWIDAPPGGGANRLDYKGKGNTHWNLNTLTLMATAGLIEMDAVVSMPFNEDGERIFDPEAEAPSYRTYQRIRLPKGPMLDEAGWEEHVQPCREHSYRAQRVSVQAMLALLTTDQCFSELFPPIYDLPGFGVRVARNCGGCPACRRSGVPRRAAPVWESPWPWLAVPLHGVGAALIDEQNRVLIHYETADLPTSERKWERMLKPIARTLRRCGIHNVMIPQGAPFTGDMLQELSGAWPIFVSTDLLLSKLPPGPAFVVVPEGTEVGRFLLRPRAPEDARVVLAHESIADPHMAGARLRDRHSGRALSFEHFKRLVEQ